VGPARATLARLARRALRGVRRAVVLGGGQKLREQDEQHHPPRRLGMRARPGARTEGDDQQGGRLRHARIIALL
jgi:hypothetical protein